MPTNTTASRFVRPALLAAVVVLMVQVALIPLGPKLDSTSFRNLSVDQTNIVDFDAGPFDYILWRTYPAPWPSAEDVTAQRFGLPGLRFTKVTGIGWFVTLSFFWTIGVNVLAVLFLGRRIIARTWRGRPRLPRLRISIERRPRLSA